MQAIEFVRQRLFLSAAIAGVLAGSAVGLFLPIRASAGDGAALGPWAPYATMPLSRRVVSDITVPPASSPLTLPPFASPTRTRSDGVE